jgi:hypothetical protein
MFKPRTSLDSYFQPFGNCFAEIDLAVVLFCIEVETLVCVQVTARRWLPQHTCLYYFLILAWLFI